MNESLRPNPRIWSDAAVYSQVGMADGEDTSMRTMAIGMPPVVLEPVCDLAVKSTGPPAGIVTVALLEWVAAVVPPKPRMTVQVVVPAPCVTCITSVSIWMSNSPDAGKPEAEATVIDVALVLLMVEAVVAPS